MNISCSRPSIEMVAFITVPTTTVFLSLLSDSGIQLSDSANQLSYLGIQLSCSGIKLSGNMIGSFPSPSIPIYKNSPIN